MDVESIRRNFIRNLFCHRAKFPEVALPNDNYLALAYTVRDRIMQKWICSARTYFEKASRTVAYLSAEFLIGPQLGQNLVNLGILEATRQAMDELGISLDALLEQEEEPGLGNGGLGRLAACYLDSLAALEIPAIGYGIRYEFGIFDQEIHDGWQVEVLDRWLRLGYPWEISHPEIAFLVKLGGHTEGYTDVTGRYRVRWIPDRVVKGIPNDTPILGYGVNTANILRLWQAAGVHLARFAGLQRGRLHARLRGTGQHREHHQDSLPQRRDARRARTCGCSRSTSSCPARCRT